MNFSSQGGAIFPVEMGAFSQHALLTWPINALCTLYWLFSPPQASSRLPKTTLKSVCPQPLSLPPLCPRPMTQSLPDVSAPRSPPEWRSKCLAALSCPQNREALRTLCWINKYWLRSCLCLCQELFRLNQTGERGDTGTSFYWDIIHIKSNSPFIYLKKYFFVHFAWIEKQRSFLLSGHATWHEGS